WFGADFNEVNTLLSDPSINQSTEITPAQAQAFRQVLSLLLSQRRPSYLLGSGFEALQTLTDSYLRIMATQGVISEALRDAALQAQVVIPPRENSVPARFMVEKKTQSVLRSRLARAIGVKSIYELDRLDLSVKTTIDFETQKSVAKALRRLSEPDGAKAAGAVGFRLLSETNDPSPIIYSLMLFERGDKGNLLRIQTDNYDQPLDINEGIKLDLGSTSKLRTMVNYLEIISLIYGQFKDFSAEELTKVPLHPRDYLSAWVIGHLKTTPDMSLEALLNQALDRRYSASPGESFFTGGGLHRFNNFTRDENNKIMSVRNALKDSVNLVFIRLMRDIVYHHLYKPGGIARWMEDPNDARRQEYLEHFADQEGQVYLRRFYSRYKGKSAQEVLEMLARRVKPKASRLTMLYQAIYPDSDIDALTAFLKSHLPASALANEKIDKLKDKYSPATFNLQVQGYITKIHPLELWLANYM
ncbi:MAG: carboxypeptidase, partial [Methylicorpusculum sp.]|nr:carboxypeptidase [Methylicorpusculum sp.]